MDIHSSTQVRPHRSSRIRTFRVDRIIAANRRSWTVVDGQGLPVAPVEDYLHWLRAVDRSDNTIRSYAFCLANLFEWLHARQCAWDQVSFTELSDFMVSLRNARWPLETRNGAERTSSTVAQNAAAVRDFYEYQRVDRDAGPKDLALTMSQRTSRKTGHLFLAHVARRRPTQRNRLAPRTVFRPQLKTINFESDFGRMLGASGSARDRLALSAMYDLGLRSGQVLGLRHGDIDFMRKKVSIVRRGDNVNSALSKQRDTFRVDAPKRFFDYYAKYLTNELLPVGSARNAVAGHNVGCDQAAVRKHRRLKHSWVSGQLGGADDTGRLETLG